MKTRRNRTTSVTEPRRRKRGGRDGRDGAVGGPGDNVANDGAPPASFSPAGRDRRADADTRSAAASPAAASSSHKGDARDRDERDQPDVIAPAGTPVAWRTASGWRVGDEEVSDLTSAMVLADLLAADMPAGGSESGQGRAAAEQGGGPESEQPDARKLQETVAQLEHALTVRVRVEQAIGVLAERHRLRPRQAFELLRSAARIRGRRVLEVAGEVVDSATNPLLRIPEELDRPPVTRRRGRMPRHSLSND